VGWEPSDVRGSWKLAFVECSESSFILHLAGFTGQGEESNRKIPTIAESWIPKAIFSV